MKMLHDENIDIMVLTEVDLETKKCSDLKYEKYITILPMLPKDNPNPKARVLVLLKRELEEVTTVRLD